jgi:hypothetical protein
MSTIYTMHTSVQIVAESEEDAKRILKDSLGWTIYKIETIETEGFVARVERTRSMFEDHTTPERGLAYLDAVIAAQGAGYASGEDIRNAWSTVRPHLQRRV